jgi:hypothetical protein
MRLHTNRSRDVHTDPQTHPQVEEVVDGRVGSHMQSHYSGSTTVEKNSLA